MAVSRWERAINEPEAAYYIHMGTLAGDPDCWYFWQRAGLPASDLKRALRKSKAPRSTHLPPAVAQEVSVPLLALTAATAGVGDNVPNIDQAEIVAKLSSVADWMENTQNVRCLRVTGEGMAPVLSDGSIVAVDLSQFDSSRLSNSVVLAWHKDYGLIVRRLRKVGTADVLLADSDRPENSVTLDRNWRILGRVVWWMSRAR
jgi:phage repressor protein C with HTH and peptisase S24 domain